MKSFLKYGLTFFGGVIIGVLGGVLFRANIDLSLSNMARGFVNQTAKEFFNAPVNSLDSIKKTSEKLKDSIL